MLFRKIVLLLVAFALFFTIASSTALAKPIEWKALSSWNQELSAVRELLIPWVDAVNKKLKGKLSITWVGPEAVPPFEQLKPVKTGVFDVLFTAPAYHAGQVGAGMTMNLFPASSAERRKAGLYEVLNGIYEKKQNLHLLGMGCDGVGLQLMLKKSCIDKADLSGLKVRSNPFYNPIITVLNGSPVKIAGSEIYSALEKGVIDGAFWPALGAKDYKWYEVVKYQLRPKVGETIYFYLVNKDSWNKLPEGLKKELVAITKEVEETARKNMMAMWEKEEKELIDLNMKICQLPEAESKKMTSAFYAETWAYIMKLDPKNGPIIKKIIDEKILKP